METDPRLSRALARLDLVRANLAKDHERIVAMSNLSVAHPCGNPRLEGIVQRLEAATGMVSHSTDALVRYLVEDSEETPVATTPR